MTESVNVNPDYGATNQIVGNGPIDRLTSKNAWAFKGDGADRWTDRDISVGQGDYGDNLAFASWATNLTGSQYSDKEHIFVKDTQFGFTTLVTPSDANGSSYAPVISRNGKKVAYISSATNIVDGDTNDRPDLFVKDVSTLGNGAVQRVDTSWSGKQGYGSVLYPALSPDGTKVAFCYTDSSIVGGSDASTWQVYLKDLVTGGISRISENAGHTAGNKDSVSPLAFSADGTRLAFISDASNLVSNDTNGVSDVFVKDLTSGQIQRASTAAGGVESASGADKYHALAFDPNNSNFLAFSSDASDLVLGDTNKHTDVFVKNLYNGDISLASLDGNRNQLDGDSFGPAFSEDGQTLFFATSAGIAGAADSNKHINIYASDRKTGALTLLSSVSDGTPGSGDSYPVLSSFDSNKIYFASTSTGLVANDSSASNDIFARTIRSSDAGDIYDSKSGKTPWGYGVAWKQASLLFSDPDSGDTHTVSVTKADGDLGNLFADMLNEPNGGYGAVGWRYRIKADEFKALAAGQTKDDTFTLTVDDGHGGTASHVVTVHLHAADAVSPASVSVQNSHGLTGLEI